MVRCNIYALFEIVVTLTELMRITNVTWQCILQCLRMGDCMESNLEQIR